MGKKHATQASRRLAERSASGPPARPATALMALGLVMAGAFALNSAGCARRSAAEPPVEAAPKFYEDSELQNPGSSDPMDFPEASLWSPAKANSYMFLDHKARRVNDIVTVNVVEAATASNKATTKGSRTSATKAGATTLFGIEGELANRVTSGFNPGAMLATDYSNAYDGSGETTREGSLVTTVAARVREVLPNNNLIIEGRREIVINSEKQTIFVTGIVRPKDISFNNIISSTAIADFQVRYGGRGSVGQNQYQGWFARFMNWIWPF
ncbi:MAG: flagellar basal body L-ring protein FlgH [Candidatus Schekmanbacteria bacterium]|nr:flagellar basal body L-ring protein FlgH [Candidatus Schekmanbacteria bacterium]